MQQIFRTLALLTVILWNLYPVVWVIGTEGVGAVVVNTKVFLVLDLLAKVGSGFLLLTNQQALSDVPSGVMKNIRTTVRAQRIEAVSS